MLHLSPVNIQSFCDNLPSNYHYKNKSELKWVISKTKQIGLSSHIIIIPFLGFDYVNIENKGSEFHKTPGKCKGKCKCVRHIVFTEISLFLYQLLIISITYNQLLDQYCSLIDYCSFCSFKIDKSFSSKHFHDVQKWLKSRESRFFTYLEWLITLLYLSDFT